MLCDSKRPKKLPHVRVLTIFIFWFIPVLACSPQSGDREPVTLKIGMESTAVNTLIYISQENNYFEENNIIVVIDDSYPSGAAAAEAMLAGKTDIATTAELFIVRKALMDQPILAIASIDTFTHMKLLVRSDRGISAVSDLSGKRVGVPRGTAADFMLDRFLTLNGIGKSTISLIDIQAPDAADSLVNGDVDAVVTWQPNVTIIEERLADRVNVWDVQSNQPLYCIVVSGERLMQQQPEAAERFVRSLVQAEDYLIHNPERAKNLMQAILGYDDGFMETVWPLHQHSVRLDQALITAMEDQARWLIANDDIPEEQAPNFLNYIYEGPLEEISPEAVTIIKQR